MFRATMCPSSGENTAPMRHVVFVTLYTQMTVWYAGLAYQTVIYIE